MSLPGFLVSRDITAFTPGVKADWTCSVKKKALTIIGAGAAAVGIVLAAQGPAQADTAAVPVVTTHQSTSVVPAADQPQVIRSVAARVASSAVSAAERAAVHATAAAGTSAVRQAAGDATQVARIASFGSTTPVSPEAVSLPPESVFDR
ncbi:hypothetical protein ACIP10_02625 [Streptomyces galbus]|uniref:hypothetical protein n=1 Tax=Streptomyces galbus TaxID=33898 RepID=UPI0037AD6788